MDGVSAFLQICSNNKLTKSRNHPKTPTDSRKAETPYIKSHRQPEKEEFDLFSNRAPTGGERADYPGAAALEVPEHLLHRPGVVPWVHSERRIPGFVPLPEKICSFRRISGWCLRAKGLKEERERERSGRELWECD